MPLILLPPSEGKTTQDTITTHQPLDWSSLVFPQLTETRQQVVETLIAAIQLPDQQALAMLKVGKSVLPEIRANVELLNAATAPASTIYTGVLYEAAQLQSTDQVLIFSGLFGITRASDYIPSYRCPMGISLPQVGSLSALWKKSCAALSLAALQQAVNAHDDVVFDARSSVYQVWPNTTRHHAKTTTTMFGDGLKEPSDTGQHAEPFWTLRAINSSGRVITHRAKHYRGLFARALLDAGSLTHAEIPDLVHTWQQQQGFLGVDVDTTLRTITVHV